MATRVEYGVEVTVNTGNFSNVKPMYRIITDVREDEHPNQAIARCEALVDKWVEAKVDEIHKDMRGD